MMIQRRLADWGRVDGHQKITFRKLAFSFNFFGLVLSFGHDPYAPLCAEGEC